jgi:hypothetical protein
MRFDDVTLGALYAQDHISGGAPIEVIDLPNPTGYSDPYTMTVPERAILVGARTDPHRQIVKIFEREWIALGSPDINLSRSIVFDISERVREAAIDYREPWRLLRHDPASKANVYAYVFYPEYERGEPVASAS